MTTTDKAKEIVMRIKADCKTNNNAYTESMIFEALIEMADWIKVTDDSYLTHMLAEARENNMNLKKMLNEVIELALQTQKNYNRLLANL